MRTRWLVMMIVSTACSSDSDLGGSFDCTPGETLRVGCSDAVGRPCSGRPIMSVCDGTVSHDECTPQTPSPPLIVVDTPPECPNRIVPCPASGTVSVGISQGGSGPYTCTWDYVSVPTP